MFWKCNSYEFKNYYLPNLVHLLPIDYSVHNILANNWYIMNKYILPDLKKLEVPINWSRKLKFVNKTLLNRCHVTFQFSFTSWYHVKLIDSGIKGWNLWLSFVVQCPKMLKIILRNFWVWIVHTLILISKKITACRISQCNDRLKFEH